MAFEAIFQPLKFKNLTVKNRVFRSNISGRFDNYDGSGNQARINWEVKFAKGGVGAIVSSFVPVQLRGRIVPNYATIDHDRHIPFWRAVGKRGARARLPVHPPAEPCAAVSATSPASSIAIGLSSTDKHDPSHGFQCERMTIADIKRDGGRVRRRRATGARGGPGRRRAARRQRLPDHAVPQLGDQRSQGRVRRPAREPRAVRPRHRQGDPHARRPRLPPADEDQRDRVLRRAWPSSASGRPATRSRTRCRSASGWSRPASTPSTCRPAAFFPHPRNPAGSDLPVDELVKTYDTMISSGDLRVPQLHALPQPHRTSPAMQWHDAAP